MGEKRSFTVLTGHCLGAGRGDAFEGAVLTIPEDLSPAEATSKLTLGYIEEIPVEAEESPETEDETVEREGTAGTEAPASEATSGQVETGDPTPEHGDPAPAMPATSRRRKPRPKK